MVMPEVPFERLHNRLTDVGYNLLLRCKQCGKEHWLTFGILDTDEEVRTLTCACGAEAIIVSRPTVTGRDVLKEFINAKPQQGEFLALGWEFRIQLP